MNREWPLSYVAPPQTFSLIFCLVLCDRLAPVLVMCVTGCSAVLSLSLSGAQSPKSPYRSSSAYHRRPCGESNGADPPEEPRSAKKHREEAEAAEGEKGSAPMPLPVPELGEDAIYEVLRRADARTLAAAACVSRRWRRLAADERLWEAACVRHWEAARDYGGARLRPVVLALGGFRRLHSRYLAPLLRPPSSPSPSARIQIAREGG